MAHVSQIELGCRHCSRQGVLCSLSVGIAKATTFDVSATLFDPLDPAFSNIVIINTSMASEDVTITGLTRVGPFTGAQNTIL
jgi:hypothetical protein